MSINDKYKKGSILKLENKVVDTVIVIGETVKDGVQYLLVAPYKIISENEVVTDQSKIILLKVSEDDNIFVETEEAVVRMAIEEILKKNR